MLKAFVKQVYLSTRAVFLLVMLFVFFRTAVADWSPVPSGSMEPTLFPGDVVWVNKTSFGPTVPIMNKQIFTWAVPSRGDVITFVPPHTDQLYVKRVMAVPGDKIRIEGNEVYVNGIKLKHSLTGITDTAFLGTESIDGENHLIKLTKGRSVPAIRENIEVPDGKYFVMGDHRNNSVDSRYWGFVAQENVMGKVTRIAISFSTQRDLFSRVALPVE